MVDQKVKITVQGKPLSNLQKEEPQKLEDLISEDKKGEVATEPKTKTIAEEKPMEEQNNQQPETTTQNQEPASEMQSTPKVSINFGIIGVGQGGGRIASTFSKRGYPAVALNTASQDLDGLDMPEKFKLFLDFALGGVGKDINLGEEAIENFVPEIKKFLNDSFGEQDIQTFLLCITGGGGTGSGSAVPMVRILEELFGMPVGVVYTLPMTSEGPVAKNNALTTLKKLAQLSISKKIHTLIVADNARIEDKYPGITYGKLWDVANNEIVESLDIFNRFSSLKSDDSLDPMDFAKIFTAGNCTIYGRSQVNDPTDDESFSSALLKSAQSGLLAEGFDMSTTEQVGVLITGRKDLIDQIPIDTLEYSLHTLDKELGGTSGMFRGIYSIETNKPYLEIYTMFSGLGLPKDRVNKLIQEARVKLDAMEAKSADTSKMQLDFEPETAEQKQAAKFKKIDQKKSAFGRMLTGSKRKKGFRDRNKG